MTSSPVAVNPFEVLGVDHKASKSDIKKAYQRLLLKWHPDKNFCSEESTEMFRRINEAHTAISNYNTKPVPIDCPDTAFESCFDGISLSEALSQTNWDCLVYDLVYWGQTQLVDIGIDRLGEGGLRLIAHSRLKRLFPVCGGVLAFAAQRLFSGAWRVGCSTERRVASIALLGMSGMCLISFVHRSEILIDRVNGCLRGADVNIIHSGRSQMPIVYDLEDNLSHEPGFKMSVAMSMMCAINWCDHANRKARRQATYAFSAMLVPATMMICCLPLHVSDLLCARFPSTWMLALRTSVSVVVLTVVMPFAGNKLGSYLWNHVINDKEYTERHSCFGPTLPFQCRDKEFFDHLGTAFTRGGTREAGVETNSNPNSPGLFS